jgi:hypothetical protein
MAIWLCDNPECNHVTRRPVRLSSDALSQRSAEGGAMSKSDRRDI